MDTNIDITHYLPHREPMLMVDLIVRMDSEIVETTFKIIPGNLFLQPGGFLSEAGLVENAAQTCSSIVAKGYYVDENNRDRTDVDVIGFISAIKSLKVHALPKVGNTINTTAALISNFVTDDYSLCTMDCRTFVGETLLLEGEINLFIQQQPNETVVKSTT
jgi:predicted hotdog family 3-hydroxylacyl-ACP dehydratase